MGIHPSAFIGNADDPAFAPILQVASELYDAVEKLTRERGYSRAFVPLLRRPNIFILADVQSIHIMYADEPAGGMPQFNITDILANGNSNPLSGEQACILVQHELGWRDCVAITVERGLISMPAEGRGSVLQKEAEDYLAALLNISEQKHAEQMARNLLAIPFDNASQGLISGVCAALADMSFEQSVFVMMRYRESENYAAIESAVVLSLAQYGLGVRLAKNKAYSDELWENVRIYMHSSKYGIAVFEEIDERSFNPNVSLELGYMYALGRRVMILKDKRMPTLPTDIVGRIYRQFDTYNIAKTIRRQIASWAEKDLSLPRIITESRPT